MATNVNNVGIISEKIFEDLFIRNIVPPWWESNSRVTYQLCGELFLNCEKYKDGLTELVIIQNALKCLDYSSANLLNTNNFKNFKRKVMSKSTKNGVKLEPIDDLYNAQDVIGSISESIGLSKSAYTNIAYGNNDNFSYEIKAKCGVLSNRLVLELYRYFLTKNTTIKHLCKVIYFLSGKDEVFNDNLYKSLRTLNTKCNLHDKNLSSRKCIKQMLDEDFIFPSSDEVILINEYNINLGNESLVYEETIRAHENKLHTEKINWEKISVENDNLRDLIFQENKKSDSMCEELLQKLDVSDKKYERVCNVLCTLIDNGNTLSAKEIERREQKHKLQIEHLKKCDQITNDKYIALQKANKELKTEVKKNSKMVEDINERLLKAVTAKRKLQKGKSYYRSRTEKLLARKKSFNFDTQIQELRDEIRYLEQEKASMEEELQSFIENELPPLKNIDGSYKNNVRACFQDLVLSGVGIKETKNVIKSVLLNLANINVENNDLPGATFARSQYAEARLIAMIQLGTTLERDFEKSDCTLQSDGTSKFGKHYGTYDISCKSGENMVLGLRGMACGDAETQLSVFKEIIDEIELVCNGSTTNIAQKILASIKNTMSDRHIVQKKFNKLLQEYRSEILPNVIEGWNSLSEVDQNKMKSINNYFCGLHYMVGLADQSEGTLKVFEKLLYDEKLVGSLAHGGYSKGGESGTLRLIRTLCKAVQERGCEKSGRMVDFQLALEDSGLPENPLIPFKGNRFNVLFYNAGIIYYLHDKCQSFFDDVFEENRLLSAVYHDLGEPAYIIGCRALGLVNKFLTGPLWRLLVKIKNILELNKYYQRIEQLSLQISNDASDFLSGNVIFFEEFEDGLMSKDDIFYKLLEPNEKSDQLTKQLLEILFGSFAMITNRMVGDHLKDGKYDKPSSALIAQSESVPNTNVYPESNFGCLDRLIREKPNANEITLEAIIMCKSNNTQQWRDELSKNEKDHWMNWAKSQRKVHHQHFLEKLKKIRKLRNERRLTKIENKKRKAVKLRDIKEEICKDIIQYGGLWKSVDDVDLNLKKLTEARKIDSLKCQLKFRQKVLLENSIVDSSLFYFSSKKNVFSSSVLKENLKKIIENVASIQTGIVVNITEDSQLNNIPIEKMNKEKDRQKLLILSMKDKNNIGSVEAPKYKKQKMNNDNKCKEKKTDHLLEKIPVVKNVTELIGKYVSHLTLDEKGNSRWYCGTVVCCKPNTDSEMIIRYDNDPTLYSFDFDEYADGLLTILPLDPEFSVGKCISQKFYDEEEVDAWWENGKIISFDPATELYTINYFHVEGDHELDIDEVVDVYETMVIAIEEDYLKHEIRFL